MEFPIWHLTTFGGGFWIALIATLHVYVAHFAVGGGLFLPVIESIAYKTDNPHLLEYTRKHTRFFLLLTMAFGAVSGVAIWIIVSLIAPQATITLIHQFVFGWAAEWVCFLGEIVALLVYYYAWDKLSWRDHLTVGWIYAAFGWFSLVLITGIIGFMLTPGDWLQTRNFWDGFFNPTFWPQVVFRTLLAGMCAALFAYITAVRIKDNATRHFVIRGCSILAIITLLGMALSGWWYVLSLPPEQYSIAIENSHRVAQFIRYFIIFGALALIGAFLFTLKLPRFANTPLAFLVFMLGLGVIGAFEYTREASRKPYIIWDYAYSNGIIKTEVPMLNKDGVLAHANWLLPELKGEGLALEKGSFLFQLECVSCHSINGPMNNIVPRTASYTTKGMDSFLSGMGLLSRYMPPFVGTKEERMNLAQYITQDIHKKTIAPASQLTETSLPAIPAFKESDDFALLAWNKESMPLAIDSPLFTLIPAKNTFRAQLIGRDDIPVIVTEDVTISYATENGSLSGELQLDEDDYWFEKTLKLVTTKDQPFPIITLKAKTADTGELLAQTKLALPVSPQAGCSACHGGEATQDGTLAKETALNILKLHDRMNGTDHVKRSKKGKIRCIECHDDISQNASGQTTRPTLSTALHSVHALYLRDSGPGDDASACLSCHPANYMRGNHIEVGLNCTSCHGTMSEHALALLKGDPAFGKANTTRIFTILSEPTSAEEKEALTARQAWTQQPDCLACHTDFAPPESDTAFNKWTDDAAGLYSNRKDTMESLPCASCHGTPHATYPAKGIDNISPLQYMGTAQPFGVNQSCSVCHIDDMEDPAHHDYMGLDE